MKRRPAKNASTQAGQSQSVRSIASTLVAHHHPERPAMPDLHPSRPDPRLERLLRQTILLSTLLVLAVPMARGDSLWFGPLPLWLLGMPLVSWWALHRFRLPLPAQPRVTGASRRRRGTVQARRRPGGRKDHRQSRAA